LVKILHRKCPADPSVLKVTEIVSKVVSKSDLQKTFDKIT
jgi:hypothetical protein